MKCERCGSDKIELRKEGYFCKTCGMRQSQKKQYTYPLSDEPDRFAGR